MSNKLENKLVARSISKMYLDSGSADINFTFKIDDNIQIVPAHKVILGSGSSVFYAMFFGSLKENDEVEIVDASIDAFKEFIQFFYLPEVPLTMENIGEVARLADKYDMLDHLNTCTTLLEEDLSKDNILWSYQLAIALGNQNLKRLCEEKITFLAKDLFKTDTFLRCDIKMLRHILQIDRFACEEVEIFKACCSWAQSSCRENGLNEADPNILKEQLGDCFYLIRFGAMMSDEIGVLMSNELYAGMFLRNELIDVFRTATVESFKSSIFNQNSRSLPSFQSNPNSELVCKRKHSSGNAYFIRNEEAIWFSTNVPVVLGELNCTALVHNYHRAFEMNFNIKILEYNSLRFLENSVEKILFTGKVKFMGHNVPKVILPQALLIKPRKMYEVRLDTMEDTKDILHYSTWKTEANLSGSVTITFHRNPMIYENERRGLITNLVFKLS